MVVTYPSVAKAPGGSPIRLGSLEKSSIDKVVRAGIPDLRECYLEGLETEPSLAGKVTLTWVIDHDGSVLKVDIKSSELGSPSVESCMLDRVMRWNFPEPDGGIVIVSHPFVFTP